VQCLLRALINTGYNICYTGFLITDLYIGCIPRNSSVCQNDINGEWMNYSSFSYKYDIVLGINIVKYSKSMFSQNTTNLLSIKVGTCFDS
jgi:hypothetical protein